MPVLESVAAMLKLKVPPAVGVPLGAQALDSDLPAGKAREGEVDVGVGRGAAADADRLGERGADLNREQRCGRRKPALVA